ncbi:MAG: flagellar biosynthesis protein FlhF [Nitrospiraceae bacterium]|nr:MAG: flagellar biosynthesis protein FlhF [Nitrospiraceae bacterium]
MKIKTIRAKNFREALSLVKKELGPDAVILSSEDKKGLKPYVEVTAAIDYDIDGSIAKDQVVEVKTDKIERAKEVQPRMSTEDRSGDLAGLQQDIKSLRAYIESMKNSGFEFRMPEERRSIFHFLREKSINDEFALKLVERAGAIEEIETVMTDDLNISRTDRSTFRNIRDISAKDNRRITMLIGPTGSGKTTTLAKLASMAIKEGKKVAMISIDTYKIGAAEQIRIYSRMIGIPLDIVANRESFRKSVGRFSDRDLILVDTTGQNPRDAEYISNLKNIYEMGMPIETQLLLSASSDCSFLVDTHKYYKSLPVDYMAFTKTDEAVKLGAIYNLCRIYQKPVAYITTGQRVPGNIEFVDSKRLTNLILRTGSV